jgi:hypothetical protein
MEHTMTSWTEPVKSLNGASVSNDTVTGSVIDLEQVMSEHAIQVTVDTSTVDGSGVTVYLLTSLDGVTYTDPQVLYSAPSPHGLNTVIVTIDAPARFLKAQASSSLTLSPATVVTTVHSSSAPE